jgi:glutathione S-transferase
MVYTLHGSITSPFVRKVRCVFDEKHVPFTLRVMDVFAPPPDFEILSPLRRIPVLTFDDRPDRDPIPDSSAICAYLESAYPEPPLLDADPYLRARALWIEEYSDTLFAYRLGFSVIRPLLYPGDKPLDHAHMAEEIRTKIDPLLAYLEAQIGDRTWFVGDDFGLADIAVSCQLAGLIHCERRDILAAFPALDSFLDRALERPVLARIVADAAAQIAARRSAVPAEAQA